MGLGSCFLTFGTASIIPHWFQRKELGFAMGIYSITFLTFPLATIIAFIVSPLMQQSLGWQSPFYLSTIGSIVCGTFFLSIRGTGLTIESPARTKTSFKEVMKNSAALKVGLIWLLYNLASAGFVTWTPTLLFTYKDLNLLSASSLSSLYMVVTMFLIPVYGWAADKYRKRKTILAIGLVGMACSVPSLIYLNGLMLIPVIIFVGVFASAIPAQALALMGETMPLEKSGIGFGMMSF